MTFSTIASLGVSLQGGGGSGGGGGTPGGSDTQVQFNDGGAFGGDSGLTFNKTSKAITLGGATVTTSSPVIDAAQTWNDGGVTFTGLKFNATDTASAAGSLLMDLQVGGASRFQVTKAGSALFRSGAGATFYRASDDGIAGTISAQSATGSIDISGGFRFAITSGDTGTFYLLGTNRAIQFGTAASDGIIRRRAASNIQLGAADAAAPVAQTLSVQSGTAGASALTVSISGTALTIAGAITGTIAIGHAVTGTGVSAGTLITAGSGTSWTVNNSQTVGPITAYFNSVGQNLTITGSQGSGPSAGGSIIFQVAPAGAAATTAQNALATALTIDSNRIIKIPQSSVYNTANIQADGYNTGFALFQNTRFNIISNGTGVTAFNFNIGLLMKSTLPISWGNADINGAADVLLYRDASNTLALRNEANAQESRVYGSYTSATNFQRMSIKTLRESSGALSGATYVTTIAIPAYANLIGVTTRVTTAVTGATDYDVGDGSDVDLWGAAIGVALGSQSRTADFTAVAAVGAAATSRTVTLTANGSNFTGGVVEICLHYLTTEAD
jgi:hypothetical protein